MHLHADAGGLTDRQHRQSLELFQSDIAPVLAAKSGPAVGLGAWRPPPSGEAGRAPRSTRGLVVVVGELNARRP